MTKLHKVPTFLSNNGYPTLLPLFDTAGAFEQLASQLFDFQLGNVSLNKGFPKGDIFKDGENTIIELALAGYNKDQLSVKIENNSLIVSASKSSESSTKNTRSLKRSAFTKVFPNFANEWDLHAADVEYKDGLLRIIVPPLEKVKLATELKIR